MRKLLLLAFVAVTGCAPGYYPANLYDNGGTVTEKRCETSLFSGTRVCHWESIDDPSESTSRYSQVEEVPVIPPVKLEPVVVDRAKYRNAAIELTRRAEVAAQANDCATAKSDADNVNVVDRDYYSTVVLRDPVLERCL